MSTIVQDLNQLRECHDWSCVPQFGLWFVKEKRLCLQCNGVVVNTLAFWTRGLRFASRPCHCFTILGSNLGQVVYSHCLPSLLSSQESGVQREFSDWTNLTAWLVECIRLSKMALANSFRTGHKMISVWYWFACSVVYCNCAADSDDYHTLLLQDLSCSKAVVSVILWMLCNGYDHI